MRYRRVREAGASYFFTVVTHGRRALFADPAIVRILEAAIVRVRDGHPFDIEAQVILPDHIHAIWSLPEGDADYSKRWRLIKEKFTREYGRRFSLPPANASRRAKGEQGIWQRRFWEHLISGEADFAAHLDYIHLNPVRHGLVAAPRDWPHSTFGEWVSRGAYESAWGRDAAQEIPAWARIFE